MSEKFVISFGGDEAPEEEIKEQSNSITIGGDEPEQETEPAVRSEEAPEAEEEASESSPRRYTGLKAKRPEKNIEESEKASDNVTNPWVYPVIKPRDLEKVKAQKANAKPKEAAGLSGSDEDFEKKFLVSHSPHLHSGETTRIIMQDVFLGLAPAAFVAVLYFGWRAALTIAVCVISCVLFEYISRRVMKRPQTIGDYSAAVTGMLLAFSLPPEINPLFCVFGSAVAIVVVKQMFGGIGHNFANPAVTARIVMMLSFPVAMTTYSSPLYYVDTSVDVTSGATALGKLNELAAGKITESDLPSNFQLFLGFQKGCLGEVCAIALLIGAAFLLIRGIISWHIPAAYLGTVAVISLIAGQDPLYQLLSGGVILGAFFMATDYVTSPTSKTGKLIFGFGCGLITMLIRLFGSMAEGVSFAILLMNIITPLIDRYTAPKPFGEEREAA